MAEAKDQTTAKPRTRTAKTAAKATVAKTAAKPTVKATAKTPAAKAEAQPEAKPEAKAAPETTATAARTATETATPAENATPAKTATSTPSPSVSEPAATQTQTSKTEAEKPVRSTPNADETTHRVSVTIPLDGAVVGMAVKAATLPLTAAKKVAQNKNGIPAYVAVGSLAVIGAVEWPVVAVGGLGLAALRRWGPLKPTKNQEPAKSA
ncbi:hypothetical protein KGQ20_33725 [Catenulispora sp. NF23]|uniref:hypothetical protein n=1 Tax=Catenulispora pinistramenti TaxID=2705254 RepID=UPI001BAA9634|nr:hypothetical protein [Catenulispora pinistramenti]MBS2537724.1 hypothetical protein [Catenulispora pinistramenti]